MAGRTQGCILTLTCVALMAGLALVIAGAAGPAWWNISSHQSEGLWCQKDFDDKCIARENVLVFEDEKQGIDYFGQG